MHIYRYSIPTRAPWLKKREGLLIEENGGWGEVAPLPGFSMESLEEALEELLGHRFSSPSVRFGVSCINLPFPKEPISVPVAALITPQTSTIPSGCTMLKLKLKGLSVKEAISFVRPFVGRYQLRLDNNRSWSLEEALHFASFFQPHDFVYFEEPVRTWEELTHFAAMTKIPIALDEHFEKPGPFFRVLKPTIVGALSSAPNTVLSSAYESSVGILQIARFARKDLPVGLDTFLDDLLDPPLRIEKGHLIWEPTSSFPIRKEMLCPV